MSFRITVVDIELDARPYQRVISYALLNRLELWKVEDIVIRDGNHLYVSRQDRFTEDFRRYFSRRRITGLTLLRVGVNVDFQRCLPRSSTSTFLECRPITAIAHGIPGGRMPHNIEDEPQAKAARPLLFIFAKGVTLLTVGSILWLDGACAMLR